MTTPYDPQPGNDPYRSQPDYRPGPDYSVQADIPASGKRTPQRAGWLGGALALAVLLLGKFKFVLLFLLKAKGIWITLVSTGVTALLYAQLFGWAFAVGLVLLILVHESGHLVVARAIGIPASLPVLIPFLGAFVNMKKQPASVAQESQMAIGGPILGSVAAALCYVFYILAPDSHYASLFLALAYFGFFINLFNLVPVTPLDGGRVLSLLSKWFNVAGLVIAAGILLFSQFRSPILFLVLIFGAMSTWQRFRSTVENPAYYEVPASTKWAIGLLYIGLLLGLALGVEYTRNLIPGLS
jgi:Zn-dependent protease